MRPSHIAAKRLGALPNEIGVFSNPITEGRANEGCFIHTARTSDGSSIRIFEKRTKLAREIQFWRDALTHLRDEDRRSFCPELYSLENCEEYCAIFTEVIDNIGRDYEKNKENAGTIARSVSWISSLPVSCAPKSAVIISESLIDRFANAINQRDQGSFREIFLDISIEEINEQLKSIYAELKEAAPYIPSHNDIAVHNIAINNGACVLVDWGKFSLNMVGAEFHNYILLSKLSGLDYDFILELIHLYSNEIQTFGMKIDERVLLKVAQYYCLQRAMSRYLSRPSENLLRIIPLIYIDLLNSCGYRVNSSRIGS